MLRILFDDFDQKIQNIHDEMDLHHSYKKKKRVCIYEPNERKARFLPQYSKKYLFTN